VSIHDDIRSTESSDVDSPVEQHRAFRRDVEPEGKEIASSIETVNQRTRVEVVNSAKTSAWHRYVVNGGDEDSGVQHEETKKTEDARNVGQTQLPAGRTKTSSFLRASPCAPFLRGGIVSAASVSSIE
jgi:hypothetical protein